MKTNGYSEALEEVRLLARFLSSTIDRLTGIISSANAKRQLIQEEYRCSERLSQRRKSDLEKACSAEEQRRDDVARCAIEHMENTLSHIRDPHFHRMEKKYIRRYGRGKSPVISDGPRVVQEKLMDAVWHLDEKAEALNHAFIPSSVSNAIGSLVPPYRKHTYMEIIKNREEVLSLAETLISFSDLQNQLARCDRENNSIIERAQFVRDEKLKLMPEAMRSDAVKAYSLFSRGLRKFHEETKVFEGIDKTIVLGKCWFNNPNVYLLSGTDLSREEVVLSQNKVGYPLKMDTIKENLLFSYSNGMGVSRTLCSLATDILYTNDDMDLILVDVKGLGSSYRALQVLSEYDSMKILCTEMLVSEELDRIEKWIADTYEKCLGGYYDSLSDYNRASSSKRNKKCLIVDDLVRNIDPKHYDQFIRIMNNGPKAGVYVICSVENKDFGNNRVMTEFIANLRRAASVISVQYNEFFIDHCTKVLLKTEVDQERIASVRKKLTAKNEHLAIIPIGKALPTIGNWQKKSSADGLVVDFGSDENGKKASFEVSSEKPYGLIIGDVRVGKSSLLHTIIIQILSNYSPEEAHIAVGDFKDGADFNVYAKGKLKSVETVVNDEDPDAMLSFLQHYVREMQARQRAFEQMEDMTGVIVQKYEDFRALYDANRDRIQAMPRIVLLIDEFQSLFDGASCASYMTELVRKGATYGIHVILSSQRAVSDNPRNGFTVSLKDYFTSRFVFKTPQNAARSLLAERCADTGRENTGIQRASLLKKGQAIFNAYMGQNEADNKVVQCFFASREVISAFIRVISSINGKGKSVLLKRNAKSLPQPPARGALYLGNSVALHKDSPNESIDTIIDDTEVLINPYRVKNMILTGSDERILGSVVSSVINWRRRITHKQTEIHYFGQIELLRNEFSQGLTTHCHKTIQEQINEMERQQNIPNTAYIVNVFIQPDNYTELIQSAGSIRISQGVEDMKRLLEKSGSEEGFSIIYSKSFKNLRSTMPYLLNLAPIHITSVGDMENLKYAMSDNVRISSCDFDIPNSDAIKAYYYNKDTEKTGKVILYHP